MNKNLEISRHIYILGLVLLPVILFPWSETPYTLPKTFFLSIFTTLSFFFFLKSKPKNIKFPNKWFLILFIIEFLNYIFLDNNFLFPRYSEGFLVSGVIFINLILALNIFHDLNLEKVIFYASNLVIFSSLIDIFIFDSRASGTIGQANFLGIFLVISFFSFIKIKNQLQVNKFFEFLYLGFLGILFIKSASLASLLGLISGIFFLKPNLKKIPRSYIFAGILILIISLSLFGKIFSAKVFDIYNQILNPKQTVISDSFLIRQKIWQKSFEILNIYPSKLILGFGPNNFNFYFEKHRGNILDEYSEANLLFDKPHNYFIEILFSFGIFYFGIFCYLSLKTLKANKNNFLIIPILIFLFFNWLDIYFKIIFFLIIFLELPIIEIKNWKILQINLFTGILLITIFFGSLLYRDYEFSKGDSSYIFSMKKNEIVELKVKNPLILISAFEYLNEEERGKIFDFLIKNFPDNKAILFHLNKLL